MENKQLTLGSLFDGSGGFPLGGLLTGQITPVWSSEIEPFAIRVTSKRLPQVKHYGDASAISGADLPPVDIITFGSPCQDMSIAGKRDGLDGSRSSLFYEAIRIVKEMRCKTNGEKPRFIVWENVPGAFSSNKGQDFKAVLEAVIGVKEPSASVPAPEKKGWPDADYYVGDGWSVAYRVLDAQWWGVPQRRKRIYLVADFADQSAPKVLFESEGVSRYSAEGFRAWQRAAAGAESGTGEAGFSGAGGRICLNDQGGKQMDVSQDVTGTLRAEEHGHQPCVLEAAGFCTEHSADARSIGYEEERSPTLRAGVVPAAIALENHPADSRVKISEDGKVQTLTSRCGTGGGNVPMVMDAVENSVESPVKEVENSPAVTLKIRSGCEGGGKGATDGIALGRKLRQITPDIMLVYISAYLEFAPQGYTVNAYRYLLKRDIAAQLPSCLEDIFSGMSDPRKTLEVHHNRTTSEIPLDQIYYLESDLRQINVYGDIPHQPICTFYGKIADLPAMLYENGFLQVGRSDVVNLQYVRSIRNYKVELRSGVELSVSRQYYTAIRSAWLEWKGQFGDE